MSIYLFTVNKNSHQKSASMFLKLQTRVVVVLFVITLGACHKEQDTSPLEEIATAQARNDDANGHLKQTKTYSSDVVKQWLAVQTSMLYRASGNPFGLNSARYMAYTGVALYEAVVPGMPAYQSLHGQLTDMPAMPAVEPGQHYHWPASANAALAAMTQNFFSTTTA